MKTSQMHLLHTGILGWPLHIDIYRCSVGSSRSNNVKCISLTISRNNTILWAKFAKTPKPHRTLVNENTCYSYTSRILALLSRCTLLEKNQLWIMHLCTLYKVEHDSNFKNHESHIKNISRPTKPSVQTPVITTILLVWNQSFSLLPYDWNQRFSLLPYD